MDRATVPIGAFAETSKDIREAVASFIRATPNDSEIDSQMDSGTLAYEIHDLDYIKSFCESLGTLARLKRDEKYKAWALAKDREAPASSQPTSAEGGKRGQEGERE